MKHLRRLAIIAIAIFGTGCVTVTPPAAPAPSQPVTEATPDWTLEPTYGRVDLESGFTPDPYTVDLVAGGGIDIEALGFYGFVAEAPDVDLYYEAGVFDLYVYVEDADGDTTLLINDPSGNWHFNDDVNGLNPGIEFAGPESGLYNIWIGTFESDLTDATLAISELGW